MEIRPPSRSPVRSASPATTIDDRLRATQLFIQHRRSFAEQRRPVIEATVARLIEPVSQRFGVLAPLATTALGARQHDLVQRTQRYLSGVLDPVLAGQKAISDDLADRVGGVAGDDRQGRRYLFEFGAIAADCLLEMLAIDAACEVSLREGADFPVDAGAAEQAKARIEGHFTYRKVAWAERFFQREEEHVARTYVTQQQHALPGGVVVITDTFTIAELALVSYVRPQAEALFSNWIAEILSDEPQALEAMLIFHDALAAKRSFMPPTHLMLASVPQPLFDVITLAGLLDRGGLYNLVFEQLAKPGPVDQHLCVVRLHRMPERLMPVFDTIFDGPKAGMKPGLTAAIEAYLAAHCAALQAVPALQVLLARMVAEIAAVVQEYREFDLTMQIGQSRGMMAGLCRHIVDRFCARLTEMIIRNG